MRPGMTAREVTLFPRDPLDLSPHQPLDHARQVVVEPGLEHRPQHFAHEVLEGAAVLHQHRLRQRVEGGIDRRGGRGRDQAAVVVLLARRRRRRLILSPRLFGRARRRRRLGLGRRAFLEHHVGTAIDGLEAGSRFRRRHLVLGEIENVGSRFLDRRAALVGHRLQLRQHGVDLPLLRRGIIGRRRRRHDARRGGGSQRRRRHGQARRQGGRTRRRRRRRDHRLGRFRQESWSHRRRQ